MKLNLVGLYLAFVLTFSATFLHAQWNFGTGCYTFVTGPATPTTGDAPFDIKAADLNNDGDLDLVTSNYLGDNLSVMIGSGTGTFAAAVNYTLPAFAHPHSIAIADFNADGNKDIAVGGNDNHLYIFSGSASGTLALTATLTGLGINVTEIIAADLNNDGYPDLARTSNLPDVRVLLNNGNGTFNALSSFTAGGSSEGLRVADFNEDSHPDLAVVSMSSKAVRIFAGSGTGTFSLITTYTTGSSLYSPLSIEIADFNNDGHTDVLTGWEDSYGSLLYGTGTGTFQPLPDLVSMAVENHGIAVADFDQDGFMDAAAAGQVNNSLQVSAYTGKVLVSMNTEFLGVSTSPFAITTGDFNNDGRPDAVTANYGTDNLSIWLSNVPQFSVTPSYSLCPASSVTFAVAGPGTYTWSNGITNSPSVALSPTVTTFYTFTATTNGCTMVGAKQISVLDSPTVAASNHTVCSGQAAVIIPSGAFTYSISGGQFTVTPNVTTTYSITGTGTNGCTTSKTINVTVNPLPTVSVNSGSICLTQAFNIIPAGAASYTITGGSAVVSPSVTTSYSVTGESLAGCLSASPAVSQVSVNPDTPPVPSLNSGTVCEGMTFTFTPTGASTYTLSDGNATFMSSGPLTYTPTGNITMAVLGTGSTGCVSNAPAIAQLTVMPRPVVIGSVQSVCLGKSVVISPVTNAQTMTITGGSFTVSPTGITIYTVTGTSSVGCLSLPATTTVFPLMLPTVAVSGGTICENENFVLVPSGAITYTFSSGNATVSPANTSTYSVTGTGTNGCVSGSPAIATVTVYARPIVSVNSGSICSGSSFTLSPAGAVGYSFSSVSSVVSPPTTSDYSVTGWSAQGCASSNTAVATVTVVALPVASVNSGSICEGQTFTLVPSGGTSHTITGNSAVVSPTTTSFYTVVVSNASGCTSTNAAIATVSVAPVPTLAISISQPTACAGDPIFIAASGADNYTWSTGSNFYAITFVAATSTVLSVVGTNTFNGCASAPVSQSLTVLPTPTVTVSGSSTVCAGESVTLTATGADSYIWSNNGAGPVVVYTPAFSGTIGAVGSSTNGCYAAAYHSVTVIPAPLVTISGTNQGCPGAVLSLTAGGASSYTWITHGNSPVITLTLATAMAFQVAGTDVNGCIGAANLLYNVLPDPVITGSVFPSITCEGKPVMLSGHGASTYTWTGGVINNVPFVPAGNGNYTVTGTDLNGCKGNAQLSLTLLPAPQFLAGSSRTAICVGESTDLSAGGASITGFYWNPGGSGDVVTVSPTVTTVYNVTAMGTNGCSSFQLVELVVDPCAGMANTILEGISVYPNPTAGDLVIKTDRTVHLKLFSETGQLVWEGHLSGPGEIRPGILANGLYVLELSGDRFRYMKRIIKQ